MRASEREQSTSMRQSFPEASLGRPLESMWLRWGSQKFLGDPRVSMGGSCAMRLLCRALAMRLPCVCHATAVRLPCGWHAFAMGLPCFCHAFAVRLPCVCHALPCVCYASWQTGVFLEGPWKYSGVPWRPWGPWGSLRGPRWVPGGVLGVPCGGPLGSWWCPWGPFGVLLGVL